MEQILHWDNYFFDLINHDWHNAFLDSVMPIWRNKKTWIPLYIFIIIFSYIKFKKIGIFLILGMLLTVGISDQVSSKLIKPNIKRPRPCQVKKGTEINLLVHCGSGYSFTSSHATNHVAIAIFLILTLGLIYPVIKIPLLFWALSIGLGQIYVGVHYPFDVLMGSSIGLVIGFFMSKIFHYFVPKFKINFSS